MLLIGYFTVIFTVAFLLPRVTVIVAVPFFTAVSCPIVFTDTIDVLLDLNASTP